MMVRHVTRQKLLGQYLHRRTGTLIRSITASPGFQVLEGLVRGWFGSHLDYAKMHEEGFEGTIAVPAHLRRHSSKGRFAREAMRQGFTRRDLATQRALLIPVREYTRHVIVPAKHFLRDTLTEKTPDAGVIMRRSILLLTQRGSVPTISQVTAS